MKKGILCLLLLIPMWFSLACRVDAIESPLAIPNNKVGIHILFDSELSEAATLVNSSGGDWGYVTIPIQSGDKNLKKWQDFMDNAKKAHLIPIVRLATEGDYFNTKVWRSPDYPDVLDFANFLDSLVWPTRNRYVVLFNEVNRGDEWGGTPDPAHYASIVNYAVTTFKSKSQDFFLISAGLDNAAANTSIAMNEYTFMREMNKAIPGIFNQLDGLSSHSYPNPAFSQPPWDTGEMSIASFQHERALAEELSSKTFPIFITETGWSATAVPENTIASYFTVAFTSAWKDPGVIAVTPFILHAGSGPFQQFSLFSSGGSPNAIYHAIQTLPKTKGTPTLTKDILGAETKKSGPLPTEQFSTLTKTNATLTRSTSIKLLFKWLLHI